jgi:hypothetical protein
VSNSYHTRRPSAEDCALFAAQRSKRGPSRDSWRIARLCARSPGVLNRIWFKNHFWLGIRDAVNIMRERNAPPRGPFMAAKAKAPLAGKQKRSIMTILDLTKATVICGVLAFLIYSFPVVGQVLVIGCLALLWLAYARKTIASFLRR